MLRPYQKKDEQQIRRSWNAGNRNVLATLPTGAGKTVIFSHIIQNHSGPSVVIAHRQELVLQISTALAREGVMHRIIGQRSVIKLAVNIHMRLFGRQFFSPSAQCAVASVGTLNSRAKANKLGSWPQSVSLWVMDEAHHILKKNQWGDAVSLFPNARGLGVTATPTRADGNGLGAHADGVFNDLIVGPSMRELINAGYLTDYRIFAPPESIDLESVPLSANGDYSQPKLRAAGKKARARIVGDVVKHYIRFASGKLGITFAIDVESAIDIAARFNAAGVPAEVVHAKTPDSERVNALKRFERRQILQLVNVDLFGEGFDLPAIEVVSFARPTQSYALFVQQFGRGLRLMFEGGYPEGYDALTDAQRLATIAASIKPRAIIIDHVGNIIRHGLPDAPQAWSLDRRQRRTSVDNDAIPLRACPECTSVYQRIFKACPWCGHIPIPVLRNGPEHVDGDLTELDAETLARMRGEVARVDMTPEEYRAELQRKHAPYVGVLAGVKRHGLKQDAQKRLRLSIAWWRGFMETRGHDESESYRTFYFKYGIDVMTAQTLGTTEADALTERINSQMEEWV